MSHLKNLCLFLLLGAVNGLLYDSKECKKSREGCEYMGSVQSTVEGVECQRWDSQEPHYHDFTSPYMFPDRDWDALANSCRNPDGESYGPWCYTTDNDTRWDYCNVSTCAVFEDCGASCKPSATCTTSAAGTEYVGARGMTVSGRPCQRWDRQFPHQHAYTNPDAFPDADLSSAENFCRNPAGDHSAPWCYTIDNTTRWETCGIPVCEDCKQQADGRGWAGTVQVTETGNTCQRWDSQTPHPHPHTVDDFPDVTLADAANFCRNPDGREGGVWCYTADPEVEWEYCAVPGCTGDCPDKDALSRRTVKHVLQIGIDGLHHDCWLNASGGVPNFLRFAQEGASSYYKVRTDMYTFSAPGWSCQLCGMDIEQTGCISNSWQAAWMGHAHDVTPVTGTEYPMPCVFNYLKGLDANIRTATFMNWPWIYWLSGRGVPGSADQDHTCQGLGLSNHECDQYVVDQAVSYLDDVTDSSSSSYTFIHIDGVDWSGHTFSWCSEPYLNYINTVDDLVGQLLNVTEGQDVLVLLSSDHGGHAFSHGDPRDSDLFIPMFMKDAGHSYGWCSDDYLAYIDTLDALLGQLLDVTQDPDWLVLLSSDHGGHDYSHGSAIDEDLFIPMFMKGPGVKAGYVLQKDTRNIDMVPSLVWAMGYDQSPHWTGQVMYEAFEDA